MPDAATTLQILGGGSPSMPPDMAAAPPPEMQESSPSMEDHQPLRLDIHPQSYYDSMKGAGDATQNQEGGIDAKLAILSGASSAPPKQPSQSQGILSDMGETAMKETIPGGLLSRVTFPADLFNLAYRYGEVPLLKKVASAYLGRELNEKEIAHLENNLPAFGTGEILHGAESAMGIEPHQPSTTAGQFMNTMGQFVLNKKPVGFKQGMTTRQALAAGAGSEVAGQAFEGTSMEVPARIVGAVLGHPVAAAAGGSIKSAVKSAREMGVGAKETIPSQIEGQADIKATPAQLMKAASNVHTAAMNPEALVSNIDQGMQQSPGVSRPTLGEVTTDQGIAQRQNVMHQQSPEVFQAREAEQQTARTQALESTRGAGDSENVGKFFTDQLTRHDQNAAAAESSAHAQTAQKGAQIGKYGELPSRGATDDAIQNAQAVRKEAESEAWQFMDEFGKAPAYREATRRAAKAMMREGNKIGSVPLAADEKALVEDIMNNWPDKEANFDALKRLRSRIGDAQRDAKSGTEVMRRLQRMKDAVDRDIESTVNGLAEKQRAAVAAMKMAPEATISAKLAKIVNRLYAANDAGKTTLKIARGGPSDIEGVVTQSEGGATGTGRAGSQAGGRSGSASGNKSAAKEKITPQFGEAQKAQYDAARAVTFRNRTLSDLERAGVVKQDGTIDPRKFDRWLQKNKDKLKGSPELREELKDWRAAQETLDQTRAGNAQAQKDFQKSRAAALIKNDPAVEISRIFKGGNPAKELKDLIATVKGDADALAGVRRAVGDYIYEKVAKAELDDVGGKIRNQQAFRAFLKTHKDALREVYGSGQELQTLEAVDAEIRRTQQLRERINIAGQSNTAKDAAQMAKQVKPSIFAKLAGKVLEHGAGAGALAGEAMGGHMILGAALGMLGKMASAFKGNGLNTIEQVEREMFINPEFARAMLVRFQAENIPVVVQNRVITALRAGAAATPSADLHKDKKP